LFFIILFQSFHGEDKSFLSKSNTCLIRGFICKGRVAGRVK